MTIYLFLGAFALLGLTMLGRNKIYIYILLILMCSIIALRGMSVGTDTYGYSKTFERITANPNSWDSYVIFDPGFAYLAYLFKNVVSDNPLDCWGLMGIFYVVSFYFFAKKYSGNVGLSMILFLLQGSYFIGFNIIRQCFALSLIMCLFIHYDITNLKIRHILVIIPLILIIGYLFHPAVMIFLVIPFLSNNTIQKYATKKTLVCILVCSFVINVSGLAVEYVRRFLESTGFEGKLIAYMSRVMAEESGYSIVKLVFITVFHTYTILVSKNVKNIFLFIGTFGIIFLNLFGQIVIEFVRIYEALMVFGLIYYVQMLTEKNCYSKRAFYKPILILFLLVIYINILMKNYGEIVPYILR